MSSNDQRTIRAKFPFNDDEAAEALAKALSSDKGSAQVLHILTQINNTQRQMIRTPYNIKYKKDLVKDLEKSLSGEFEEVILALMETPTKYDVVQLNKAVKGVGTSESVLIEILCSRTDTELVAIKNEYQSVYGRTLEADLGGDTSGDFKDILITILQRPVETNNNVVDVAKIKQDVRKILADKKKPDKAQMKIAIASLPAQHLTTLVDEYAIAAGHPIDSDIEKQFNGEARKALLALIQCSRNRTMYFANLLRDSVKDPGTRYHNLIRLIVTRSEIDLASIREAYLVNFKKALAEEVTAECRGPHRDYLVAIIRGNSI